MTTPIRVTGTIDDQEYSLNVAPGDVWPNDRSAASSKAAAVVLCSVGEAYAPAPSCGDVVLSLDDPKTVLACLVNETKILSITPPTQFVPSAAGPPGSADGAVEGGGGAESSARADFTNGLSLLGDFGAKVFNPLEPRGRGGRWERLTVETWSKQGGEHKRLGSGSWSSNPEDRSKVADLMQRQLDRWRQDPDNGTEYEFRVLGSRYDADHFIHHLRTDEPLVVKDDTEAKAYAMAEPRDERGRWVAVQSAIASLKVAAHSLLREPGVGQDSGLQENLANAAGAARTRDHVGTRAALDRVADSLNRLGPQVVKPFPARSHPQVEHVQGLLDEALQAHADLVPVTAPVGRATRDARGYVPGHDD